jgi:16S rRNA (adenine1518-N6/adenine1519-N6)-dimethyltransferase
MDILKETKKTLKYFGVTPREKMGQNFLINYDVIKQMISYASISKDDTVLDIGAGLGFLTEKIAEKAYGVIAVEKDPYLMKGLIQRLNGWRNIQFLYGDALKIEIPRFDKVVSTPPYYISTPLLFWLLDKKFKLAIMTFQKELATRLVATAGSKDYCRLSVSTYYQSEVEILDHVSKKDFWPIPSVDSIIVRLKPKKPPFLVKNEKLFFEVVRVVFSQKNRKLRNAIFPLLRIIYPKKTKREIMIIADRLDFHSLRPRNISPEDIGLVSDSLSQVTHKEYK